MAEVDKETVAKIERSIESIGVGAVLGRGVRIWLVGAHAFVAIGLIVFLPLFAQATYAILRPEPFQEWKTLHEVLALVGTFVLGWIVAAIVVNGVFSRLRGRPVRLVSCFVTGFSSLPQVVLVWFLTSIGLLVASIPGALLLFAVGAAGTALPVLGLALALPVLPVAAFPVLYFFCPMWVAPFVCVVERLDGPDAIGRSWKITEGNRLRIIGILMLLGLTLGILGRMVAALVEILLPAQGVAFVFVGLAAVAASMAGVVSAVLYHDLRVVVEGVDAEALGRVFE